MNLPRSHALACNLLTGSPGITILMHMSVQRYIVRIIFMVPLYALMSFFSLVFEAQSVYFGSIRDW